MSGFKSSALVVSQKATTVTPDISGSISIVARNDHLQAYNGITEQQIPYTSEVASISGSLQSQISAITVPTSATFLSDYDNRYVNVSGDTMTGNLIISSGSYISSPRGSGIENEGFGKFALINNTTGIGNLAVGYESLKDNTIGHQNTSIGYRSLFANQVGNFNTATGCGSLTSNISGSYNTAFGFDSLYINTSGTYNTATGYRALFGNMTGNYNVGNGVQSLYSLTAGDNNIAIGYRASYVNQTGSNNVTIGQHAGRNDLGSNKLYIDSSTSTTGTSATALVYGEFDTGKVWIKGKEVLTTQNGTLLTTTASISGDLQTQINTKQAEITLVAGTNVTISESPTNTWTINSTATGGGGGASVYFSASTNAGQTLPHGGPTTIIFEDESRDSNSAYNTSTGIFTVPVSGDYFFHTNLLLLKSKAINNYIQIIKNSTVIASAAMSQVYISSGDSWNSYIGDDNSLQASVYTSCNVNDTIKVAMYQTNGDTASKSLYADSSYNLFFGYKII